MKWLHVCSLLCVVPFMINHIHAAQCSNSTQDNSMLSSNSTQDNSMLREKIIEGVLANYDRRFPPLYNDVKPVEVEVQMYVLSIFDIDAAEMAFSMSMFLRQRWTDFRLKYEATDGLTKIELDHGIRHEIWVPDLSFMSDTNAYFHDVTVPNRMMFLYPSGYVSYSTRVTGRFTCFMELQKFPFDEQHCVVELESYGYTASVITFQWAEHSMTFKDGIKHSQFEIGEPKSFKCDSTYITGNYSCLGISIPFKRRFGFYLIQVYAPSILIVMLSWMSFWLNIDATPARISLGILTVLTISTNGNLSVGMAQRVSYIRAIDVWNSVCLILVFAAVLEYAYICVAVRVHERRKEEFYSSQNGVNIVDGHTKESIGNDKQNKQFTGMVNREKARTVEKASRIVFPVVFLLFNVVYWVYYILI